MCVLGAVNEWKITRRKHPGGKAVLQAKLIYRILAEGCGDEVSIRYW